MPKTASQKNYKKKCWRLTIDFYPTEEVLRKHVESQPQKQTYIKNLIRADLANHRTCPTCHSDWHHREIICPNCGTNMLEPQTSDRENKEKDGWST